MDDEAPAVSPSMGRTGEPPALVDLMQCLVAQTDKLKRTLEERRDRLDAKIREEEQHVVALYCCHYPEMARKLNIPDSEIRAETINAFEGILGAISTTDPGVAV